MHKFKIFRVASVLWGIFLALMICFPGCSSSQAGGSNTTISHLQGDVQVLKSGKTEWVQAQLQMVLGTGDSLKTGIDSLAVVTFFEGSTIELKASTHIRIAELVQAVKKGGSTAIRLKQEIGETLNTVKKLTDPASRYEDETPVAIAGVRGSQMFIKVADNGKTTVQNLEGSIAVTAQGKEVLIPVGNASTVEPGQPPSAPVPVAAPSATPSASVRVNVDPENDLFNQTGQPVTGNDYLDIVGESIDRNADGYWVVTLNLKGNIPDTVDSPGVVEWDVMVDADQSATTGWQSSQLFNDLGIDYYISLSRAGSNLSINTQRVTQSTEPYLHDLQFRTGDKSVSIWFKANAIDNSTRFNFIVLARQYARTGDPQSLIAADKLPERYHFGISSGGP
jgi:hypothetical protein